jgi:hypothetical protein
MGCFAVVKGIAAVVGPLIAAALHDTSNRAKSLYGGFGFRNVEIFVGPSFFSQISSKLSQLKKQNKKQVRWQSRLVLGVFASYFIRRQKESYSKHRDDVHKPLETVDKKECCNWNKFS